MDIWALGVLLYQLCWWRTPFEDAGSPHGVSTMAILNARYKAPLVSSGLPPYSPGITALLRELLEPDPDRRPAARQVLLRVRELMRENEIGYFTDLPALGGGGAGSGSAGGSGAASPTADDDDLLGILSLSVNPPAPPPPGGAAAALPTTRQPSPISAAHEPLALSLSLSASASRSAAAGGGGGGGGGGRSGKGSGRVPMPPPIVITPGKGHKGGNSGVMDLSASASASLAGAGSTSGHKPPPPQLPAAPGMGRKSLSFARLVGLADGAQQAVPEGEEEEEDWQDEGGLDWTMGAGDLAVSASSTRRRGSSGATTATSLGVSGGGGGGGARLSDLDLSDMATVNRAMMPRSSSASSLSGLYDEATGRVKNPKTALGVLWQRRMRSFMGGGGGGGGGAGSGEKGKRSWVVKATSREPGQPKAKYVRKIVLAVWERQMSSSTFFIHLYQRPVLSHPVVALKGLVTTLKLLQQGPRDFLRECHPCVTFLDDIGRHWGAVLGKVATDPTHEQLTRSCTAEGYTSVVPYLLAGGGVAAGSAIGSSSPSHKRQHLDAASMDLLARLARLLVAKLNFHEHHPAFATHFTAIPAMLGYETVPVAGGEEDFKALSRLLTLQDAILHTGRLVFAAKNEGVAATARWLLLPLVEEAYTVLVACTFLLASLLELSARAAAGLPLPAPVTTAATAGTPARKRSTASSSSSSNGAGGPGLVVEWRQRVTALLALREQYEGQLAQLRQLYADAERVEEVRAMKRVPLLPASVPVALDGALNWKPSTMRSPLQGFLDRARMEEEQGAALALGLAGLEDETPRTAQAPAQAPAPALGKAAAGGMPVTVHTLAKLEDGDLPLSSSSGHGGPAGLAFAPVPAPPALFSNSNSSSSSLARLPPLPGPALPPPPLASTAAATAVATSTALSMATWESFADTAGFSNQPAAAAVAAGCALAVPPPGTGSGSPTFFSTRTPQQHSQLEQQQQRIAAAATARPAFSLVGASVGGKPAPPTTPALGPASMPGSMASSSSPQPLLASTTAQQQQQQPAPPAGAEGDGEWFLPSSVQAAAGLESVSGLASVAGGALASSAGQPLLGAASAGAATPGRGGSTVESFLQTTAQLDGSLVLPVVSPSRGSLHPNHQHHHHTPGSLPPRMSIAGVPVGGAEGQAMLAKGESRDLLEWSSSSDEGEDEEDDLTGTTGSVAALNTENMSRIIGVGAGMGGSAVIMGASGALGTVDGGGVSAEASAKEGGAADGGGGGESKRAPEDQPQVQAQVQAQQQAAAAHHQQSPPPQQQYQQQPPQQQPPAPALTPAQQQAAQEKQARARRREARAQPWRAHMKPAVATALATCLREFEAHASTLVPLDDIVWGETIGHGAFATVYRAYCRGQDVAVKKLVTQNNLPMAEKSVRDFASEVSLLRVLRHPNVIAFLGTCADPVAVLTEFCHKGNLFMVLNEKARYKDISWARKLSVARGLADGMHYLHTRDPILIHRDLKSLNVLLTRDWSVKITDFGLSRFKPHSLSDIMTMQCGTYHWMAPEVINSTKYTEKADVYSFAIILWEIYARAIPYDGMQPVQVVAAVINRGERPPLPADCPAEYATLVRACWAHDAAERPSFSEIVEWLRSIPA